MKIAVIVAAGLATRLKPISEVVPKVLINYGQHTALKHLYDLYNSIGAEKVIAILPSKFIELAVEYSEYIGLGAAPGTFLEFVACDEPYGSAYAISKIFDRIEGHQVIFNWSDIIPDKEDLIHNALAELWARDVVFLHGDKCRYLFNHEERLPRIQNVGTTGGNVIGLYQIQRFKPYTDFHGKDFVDCYDFSYSMGIKLNKVVDVGDFNKLVDAHKGLQVSRAFNSVEIQEYSVIKSAVTPEGITLQKDEVDWYKKVKPNNNISITSMVYEEEFNRMLLGRIHGKPLAEHVSNMKFDEFISKLLDNNLSEPIAVTPDVVKADYLKEFKTKIISRCNDIGGIIDQFSFVKKVNGRPIFKLETLLDRAWQDISRSMPTSYQVIHGDPNFSNILVEDKTDKLFLIDPRGYFGNTKVYGPKDYDIAKILYALSGFDMFNRQPDWAGLSLAGEEVFVEMQPLRSNWQKDPRFEKKHHVMVALIWVALAGYFKNNPYKALAAYFHGLSLLTDLYSHNIRQYEDGYGKLIYGLESRHPVMKTIITRFPEKWLLVDRETGQEYVMSDIDTINRQWKRIL